MYGVLARLIAILLVPCLLQEPGLAVVLQGSAVQIQPVPPHAFLENQALSLPPASSLHIRLQSAKAITDQLIARWQRSQRVGQIVRVSGAVMVVGVMTAQAAGFARLADVSPVKVLELLGAFGSSVVSGLLLQLALRHWYRHNLYYRFHSDNISESLFALNTAQDAMKGDLTPRQKRLFRNTAFDFMQSEGELEQRLGRALTPTEQTYWQALRRAYATVISSLLAKRHLLQGFTALGLAYLMVGKVIQAPIANLILAMTVGTVGGVMFMFNPVDQSWSTKKWLRWIQLAIAAVVILGLWIYSLDWSLLSATLQSAPLPASAPFLVTANIVPSLIYPGGGLVAFGLIKEFIFLFVVAIVAVIEQYILFKILYFNRPERWSVTEVVVWLLRGPPLYAPGEKRLINTFDKRVESAARYFVTRIFRRLALSSELVARWDARLILDRVQRTTRWDGSAFAQETAVASFAMSDAMDSQNRQFDATYSKCLVEELMRQGAARNLTVYADLSRRSDIQPSNVRQYRFLLWREPASNRLSVSLRIQGLPLRTDGAWKRMRKKILLWAMGTFLIAAALGYLQWRQIIDIPSWFKPLASVSNEATESDAFRARVATSS